MSATNPSAKKLWGVLNKRERWGLSRRGWLAALMILCLGGALLLLGIHPFLAITEPVDANILVIEGWVHPYAIQVGANEYRTGKYKRIFTTGGPIAGTGGYINDYNTSASVGAGLLRMAGLSNDVVQMVPSHQNGKDRTYHSAMALRNWFAAHDMRVPAINVLTEDAHARRSRMLFREAFGKNVKVGIISVANPDYDARRWWRYSEGVREVIGETIAYLYARLIFSPSGEEAQKVLPAVK